MKKVLYILITGIFASNAIMAQTSVQASIKPLSGIDSNVVVISLNPTATVTTRVSGISLTLGIPVPQAGAIQPVLTIINTANTSVSYPDAQFVGVQTIGGVDHYVYDFQGSGSVTSMADDRTYTTGTDNEIVRVRLIGGPLKAANVKLLSFPDFGTSGNSLFGLSFNGTDVANPTDPFYSIPSVSLAANSASSVSVVSTTGLVPLPVKFLGFNIVRNKDKALLNWSVAEESSITDKYEVLRSTTGVDFTSFTTIATIKALNNGRSSNIYDFTQENLSALKTKGVIYFRIKQIDKDGKFVYTDIKNLRLNPKGILVGVYPNPIKQNTTLTFDLVENSRVNYSITDAAGKMIEAYQVQGFKGSNIKTLNLGKYAAGAYTLKVQAGDEIITLPLVKATN